MDENVSQTNEAKEAQPEAANSVEKKKEYPIETAVSPLIPETRSMVERAEVAGDKISKLIETADKLVARNEALVARMMLSGRAEAGGQFKTPEQKEKDEIEEEAKKAIDRFR